MEVGGVRIGDRRGDKNLTGIISKRKAEDVSRFILAPIPGVQPVGALGADKNKLELIIVPEHVIFYCRVRHPARAG